MFIFSPSVAEKQPRVLKIVSITGAITGATNAVSIKAVSTKAVSTYANVLPKRVFGMWI